MLNTKKNLLDDIDAELGHFLKEAKEDNKEEQMKKPINLQHMDTIMQKYELVVTDEGVEVSLSELFRILFKIMNGSKKTFIELIKILHPCYRNFLGLDKLLDLMHKVVSETQFEYYPEVIETFFVLIIYAAYAEKKKSDSAYIDILATKYKQSLGNYFFTLPKS
jgi:antitoxin component HigA of HigAB toxin-antitoxin module